MDLDSFEKNVDDRLVSAVLKVKEVEKWLLEAGFSKDKVRYLLGPPVEGLRRAREIIMPIIIAARGKEKQDGKSSDTNSSGTGGSPLLVGVSPSSTGEQATVAGSNPVCDSGGSCQSTQGG